MKRLAILLALFVSPLGCKKALDTTPGPDETVKGLPNRENIAGGGGGGGGVGGVRAAVGRTVNANDIKNLHLFMENASGADPSGQLPDKQTIIASLKMDKDCANLVKDIEEGLIVLTGNRQRESVWAYEKNAPSNGGWLISNSGAERVTNPTVVKQRLGLAK